jgi:hypothetical protein
MSEHGIFSLKPDLRLEWRGQGGHHETQKPDHLGDSVTSSTRIGFSVHTTITRLACTFRSTRMRHRREQFMLLAAFCLRHFSADFIICTCEFEFRQAQLVRLSVTCGERPSPCDRKNGMDESQRSAIFTSSIHDSGRRMLNDQSSGVRRAAGVEFRPLGDLQSGPKQRENDFTKRPLHFADRSRLPSGGRSIENGDFYIDTFTLPLEAARLKVRDVIDRNPQRGYLEIVQRWRQRPDGLIEFTICRLPRRTE